MRVPILCYHRIEAPPASNPTDSNFTDPSLFAEQMAMLAERGYLGVTVDAIVRWQRGDGTLPSRAIGITFDDAYASVPQHAIPVLERLGWTATIFAVSTQLGGTNLWDHGAPVASLLDAAALSALAARGHEIGSHSQYHQRLTELSDARLDSELLRSRATLESSLGLPVNSFAFPYGSHNARVLAAVERNGYSGACTLKRWGNTRRSNPLRLGRMSVGGPLAPRTLRLKLAKLLLTPTRA